MKDLPAAFANRIMERHGEQGTVWLQDLSDLLDELCARWSIQLLPPFKPLTYNYVAPAVREDGVEAVLKVGHPPGEFSQELAALEHFDGQGAATVLASDEARGALLLERIKPGTPLVDIPDDDEATQIAARLMKSLWRPAPEDHPFPTIANWAIGFERLRAHFDGGAGPFPSALVDRAERLFGELVTSMAEPVVLHGDLHHWNILSSGCHSWSSIDPKGVVGEPAYEVGALLRNPMPRILLWPEVGSVLDRRIDQCAEILSLDRERLRAWALAQAVLAGWWAYEDHGQGWQSWVDLARILARS
jgi:streptomycin 6-kinase